MKVFQQRGSDHQVKRMVEKAAACSQSPRSVKKGHAGVFSCASGFLPGSHSGTLAITDADETVCGNGPSRELSGASQVDDESQVVCNVSVQCTMFFNS